MQNSSYEQLFKIFNRPNRGFIPYHFSKQKSDKGFTLIELLVVIAIIGILAAIILASLGVARGKGNDAKIQEQLNSVRNAAETFFAEHNNYGDIGETDCQAAGMGLDTTTGFSALMASSTWPNNVIPTCVTDANGTTAATAFAAWHVLDDGVSYWCVDSGGVAKYEPSQPASTATACP